jgi:hypothetical protein
MTAPELPHRDHWEDFPAGSVRRFGAMQVTRADVLESRAMGSRPDVGLARSLSEVLNQHGEAVQSMEGRGHVQRAASSSSATTSASLTWWKSS